MAFCLPALLIAIFVTTLPAPQRISDPIEGSISAILSPETGYLGIPRPARAEHALDETESRDFERAELTVGVLSQELGEVLFSFDPRDGQMRAEALALSSEGCHHLARKRFEFPAAFAACPYHLNVVLVGEDPDPFECAAESGEFYTRKLPRYRRDIVRFPYEFEGQVHVLLMNKADAVLLDPPPEGGNFLPQ